MKIIEPGHLYELNLLDKPRWKFWAKQRLKFVKREGSSYPGNIGHHEGTNIQEVLRALIDRVRYLNHQIPDSRNDDIVVWLRSSLLALERRAADRHGRELKEMLRVAPWAGIETDPTCPRCGHIQCPGTCH